MNKLLSEFAIGDRGTISSITGEGRIRRRILDMGLTPGAKVEMRKKAPFGDPIEVNIRGYELTLRKIEAAAIEVEMDTDMEEEL